MLALMELNLKTNTDCTLTSKEILLKENWRQSKQGWLYWATAYNSAVASEGTPDLAINVDILPIV